MTRTALCLAVATMLLAVSSRSEAQGLRSYVSSTGGGTACTVAAPCGTLQAAHDHTIAGGEVRCLDAGPTSTLDSLAITKSITIDCNGAVYFTTVNGPGIVVKVRNATVNPFGLSLSNGIGIDFQNGAALFLENCIIEDWNAVSAVNGPGIGVKFAPPSGVTAKLHVTDCIVRGNGLPASGGGIIVQPAGTGSARVIIERTRVENNTYGIFANGTGSTGVISLHVRDSVVGNNAVNGISSFTSASGSVTSITVDHSASVLNGGAGISAQGAKAFVLLTETTVMSNATGLSAVSGGAIFSYQNNRLTGNVSDGAPTNVLAVK